MSSAVFIIAATFLINQFWLDSMNNKAPYLHKQEIDREKRAIMERSVRSRRIRVGSSKGSRSLEGGSLSHIMSTKEYFPPTA
jgi:hypothetical protein